MTDNKFSLPLAKLYPEIANLEEMEAKVDAEIARRKERRRLIRADLKAYREAAALLEKRGAVQAAYTPAEGEDAKAWKLGDSEPVPRPSEAEDPEGDAPFRGRKELARGTEVTIDEPGTPFHNRHGRVQHDTGRLIWVLLDGAEGGMGFRPDHVVEVTEHWHPAIGDRVRVLQDGVWLGHHGTVVGEPADDGRHLWRIRLDGYTEDEGTALFHPNKLTLVRHTPAPTLIGAITDAATKEES